MMVEGSRNINFHSGGREKRGGTKHVNTTALSGNPSILGMFQFRKINGNSFLILYASDGKVYKNFTDVLAALTPNVYPDFQVFNDKLYIVNGVDPMYTWDGESATLTEVTDVPLDWSGSNQPAWLVTQGRGNSRRLAAGGCPNVPHNFYVSDNTEVGADPDFSQNCVTVFVADTNDGIGLVGAIRFGEQIICFGQDNSFFFDDTNVDSNLWGFKLAPWSGGAAHQRAMVKTPNDVIVMDKNGDIVSIFAVRESHDYKSASLARPMVLRNDTITGRPFRSPTIFLDNWMRRNANLGLIEKFHLLYDPNLRAIRVFFVRSFKTVVDSSFLYFIDRPPNEAWMAHNNYSNASGFDAASSVVIEDAVGLKKLYTGDYSGRVWELESKRENDNGNAYYAGFTTPQLFGPNFRHTKNWKRVFFSSQAYGKHTVTLKTKVDNISASTQTADPEGTAKLWNTKLWNQFTWGSHKQIVNKSAEIKLSGVRVQLEIYNETVNQKLFISALQFDHEPLSKRAS